MKKGPWILTMLCFGITACSQMKNKSAAQSGKEQVATLAGTWELDLIPYSKGSFDSLYKDKKPTLTFEPAEQRFYGNSSCNGLSGKLDATGNKINFKGDILMTMKGCFGDGEPVFMENLKKVTQYTVSSNGKELTLIQGDVALMHFHKK